jgi:hypothetical protein
LNDVFDITQNVARFASRDQDRREELRDLFHPNPTISVIGYSGPIEGFVERSEKLAAASRSPMSDLCHIRFLRARNVSARRNRMTIAP